MRGAHKAVRLSVYALGVILLLVLAYVVARNTSDLSGIKDALDSHKNTLRLFRWIIIILIVGCWPFFVNLLVKKKGLDQEQSAPLKSFQWKLAMYLVVFEVLVVEGFPLRFVGT